MHATPVVVGVGDTVNRSLRPEDAREPLDLMSEAILNALKDTGLSHTNLEQLQRHIDSIDVVQTWTWPYPDLPGALADKLGCSPRHKFCSDHGGNQPAKLFDEASKRIASGESRVAVVVGGEALASLSACASAKQMPPKGWTKPAQNVESVFSPTTRDLGENLGAIHKIGAPIHIYPLYEHGFRAHRQQSPQDNNEESATLYAEFASVAKMNPYAWQYGKPAATKEFIGTVSKKNRMICSPYPLLMNAFNTVNLAGACLLMSAEYAQILGIPSSRWVYPLGGAGTRDSNDFWQRPNFYSSPSITKSLDAAMEISRLSKDDINMYDFYSCFPIVPKLACQHLGLPIKGHSVTLLGGLTSFGGAGNNYSTHALIEMVRKLRGKEKRIGLVLANGGWLTYQHVVCLSSQPRAGNSPYPQGNPLPDIITDVPVPTIEMSPEGAAYIETYTVEFNKDSTPLRGHIVGRLSNGHRFIANHDDESTLQQLCSTTTEQIGRAGWVKADPEKKGRNIFTFTGDNKL